MTDTPDWVFPAARYGQLVAFCLAFVLVVSMQSGPFAEGALARTLAGLTAGLLLVHGAFLVVRMDAALEADVLTMAGNPIDTIDTSLGALVVGVLECGFGIVIASGVFL